MQLSLHSLLAFTSHGCIPAVPAPIAHCCHPPATGTALRDDPCCSQAGFPFLFYFLKMHPCVLLMCHRHNKSHPTEGRLCPSNRSAALQPPVSKANIAAHQSWGTATGSAPQPPPGAEGMGLSPCTLQLWSRMGPFLLSSRTPQPCQQLLHFHFVPQAGICLNAIALPQSLPWGHCMAGGRTHRRSQSPKAHSPEQSRAKRTRIFPETVNI